ncbi:MAG: arginine--tRNA ligase [Chloroflexaceae bacterium]
MEYALDRFVAAIQAALSATDQVPAALIDLQTPKPNIPADMAFPTFRVAKELGVAPPKLAQDLAAALQFAPDALVGTVETAGPFLNFTLHPERLAAAVITEITHLGDSYGHDDQGHNQRVVVDYSSPNVAKRMHVGHIRSTIIGQSLVNIFRALGYQTIGDNHLGDWGKQFGVIIAAIERYGRPQAAGEAELAQVEELYARYNDEMKEQPELDEIARQRSLLLEQGDPQARQIWQWCVEMTLAANQRNYNRLGVQFDHMLGESFYEDMLPGVIQDALDAEVARRDADSAVVVDAMDKSIPTFLLQRSDGATLYLTRDLATIKYRQATFAPAKMAYVVGQPQELHFRQLFALARAVNYVPPEVELVHVPFGTVFDAGGQTISTRKGNMIFLETLLDEATARARRVVDEKSPDLSDEEKDTVAEAVGIGAVIYNDLYQDTRRNITLDWDRMLAREGNSATYLQYSHARCCSIIRRAAELPDAGQPADAPVQYATLTHPAEQSLIKHLAKMPWAVREAGTRYAPFVLADWCYTTAREFGVFFEQCPVLRAATPELRASRLALVAATAQALRNGLGMLGIKAPERM